MPVTNDGKVFTRVAYQPKVGLDKGALYPADFGNALHVNVVRWTGSGIHLPNPKEDTAMRYFNIGLIRFEEAPDRWFSYDKFVGSEVTIYFWRNFMPKWYNKTYERIQKYDHNSGHDNFRLI